VLLAAAATATAAIALLLPAAVRRAPHRLLQQGPQVLNVGLDFLAAQGQVVLAKLALRLQRRQQRGSQRSAAVSGQGAGGASQGAVLAWRDQNTASPAPAIRLD
jgi:hypothetical protein